MEPDGRIELIRGLCSFEGRLAGTDAERRAANWLAEQLRGRGRRAEIEPIHVHPQYGLVHAIHCALGVAGSLVAVAEPIVGFALVLFAATAMYLDLNGRLPLVRRLFFRRASQNVVSPGHLPDAPARLFLCAHYDAARSGAIFAPSRARAAARLGRHLPFPFGRFRVLFWALALLLPLIALRMAGIEITLVGIVQLPPTIVLLVGIFALVDVELSPVSPGANDNASGVATVLDLAAELDREPPEALDVWVLLTGGEECLQEGMNAFLSAHRRDLDRDREVFLCLDTVGAGTIRYETAAGWVASYDLDRRLVELAGTVAEAGGLDEPAGDEGDPGLAAEPLASGVAGDSLPPRIRRFRSLGITCLDEDGWAPHRHLPTDELERVGVERAGRFTLAWVRALDRDISRRAAARAGAGDRT